MLQAVEGTLENWKEKSGGIVTVGTQEIFVLYKRGQNEHCLDKIKFGKTSSTSQLREVISETDCLQVSSANFFCLYKKMVQFTVLR